MQSAQNKVGPKRPFLPYNRIKAVVLFLERLKVQNERAKFNDSYDATLRNLIQQRQLPEHHYD